MILLDLLDQCMKLSSLLFCKCASLCSVSLVVCVVGVASPSHDHPVHTMLRCMETGGL